ncbi:Exodeoxyribonuclease V beta chain [Waddlia chondrophila 2032/99]|uniref:RecBCD enzyme subunit RecB n=1 Tax=Waddlia chondrophila 2032/99 TaxID=765953 RepID=F8LBG0_9BACT|nr:Exodeoxyribonuclease V beta chain [Waddlia chondrophila 2032/99]
MVRAGKAVVFPADCPVERKEEMNRFDILNRETKIDSHIILEASAGTGKTFSIENLVVRLLLEGEHPLRIDEILIVTFTKMATSDLRVRVRDTIENVVNALEKGVLGRFDYLEPIDRDERKKRPAIRLLERALIGFDEAQIFTIHGFCYRMLAEHGMDGCVHPDPKNEGKGIREDTYKKCVMDYFRTGLSDEKIGLQHRNFALSSQRGSVERLEKTLGKLIAEGVEIEKTPTRNELFIHFKDRIERLKKVHCLESIKLREDLKIFSKSMKANGFDKSQLIILPEILEKNGADESDFECLVENGHGLLHFLNPANKKVKFPADDQFHYPNLPEILNDELCQFKYKNYGIARMAYDCKQLMKRQFEEEELHNFDDLLELMRQKLKEEKFLKDVRSRYRAAIVDEFQDTDPRQWEIFKKTFPPDDSGWGRLYLVGDPKQSIYAFRQADIYTYLEAADAIGRENLYSLDTNYRSQPSLVKALNHLFSAPFSEGWMPLPRLNTYMNVPTVQWDDSKIDRVFQDNLSALHWCIHQTEKFSVTNSEDEAFFPFIVQEIQRLRKEHSIPLNSFAVLVADRHQAKRVSEYLKRWNLPSQRQRVEPISESMVIPSMRELLYGIMHHRDESSMKVALGGPFLRWTADEILQLDEDSVYAEVQARFRELDEIWKSDGLSVCMEKLFMSRWKDSSKTVLETLLEDENGSQFYADFQHVMELLLDSPKTPSEAILFLEKFLFDVSKSEEELKRRLDTGQDCVQIITIHSSKGLEYDIVFALGLVNRPKKDDLYYIADGYLRFVLDQESADFVKYRDEKDAEKMRSLYVACTRSKYRLYIPYIDCKSNGASGTLSPMELFVGQFSKPLESFLKESSENRLLSYTVLNDVDFDLLKEEDLEAPKLMAPTEVVVRAVSKMMTSFSGLANVVASDQSGAPHQFDNGIKSCHTLPSGSATGTLLHTLLEEIPFEVICHDAVRSITPFIKGTQYEEWKDVLAEIVFHAVSTPFIKGCALKDIDPNQCKFETEFLYSYNLESYMKGFIDLMFAHEGKFYLLDWKSNWLGTSSEIYREDVLVDSMNHHDYFKQAEIYTEALKKYLEISHKKPFQEIFGGVYYIYLRGLPKYGVKFIPPSFFYS